MMYKSVDADHCEVSGPAAKLRDVCKEEVPADDGLPVLLTDQSGQGCKNISVENISFSENILSLSPALWPGRKNL